MRGRLGKLAAALLGLGSSALSIPLVLGFFGAAHPAFDSLAHFRIHLAAMVALSGALLLFFRRWRFNGAVALALGLASAVATLGLPFNGLRAEASAGGEMPRYRLLQMNLRFTNPQPEAVLSLIGETRPDVITLEEVSDMWREKLVLLEAAYPHRIVCPPPSYIGGVAILSRRPFVNGKARCEDRGAMAVAAVDFGGEVIEIAALHLGWPWPREQPWQVKRLASVLATIGNRAILAGDFNATPWSRTVRRIAEAGGLKLTRWVGPTWLHRRLPSWLRPYVGLPIDHVMVKGGILAGTPKRLPAAGSDHLPVLMEFSLLPEEEAPAVMQAMAK